MSDDKKVILVTGATSGIGLATATRLAADGHRVFGTSRDPAAAAAVGYELLPLEVSSDESAERCVRLVAERTGGRIDVLVNNVGTGILGAAEETSVDEAKRLFDVNFFGAVRLTNRVLPLMRQRRAGTLVSMSSAGGVGVVPFAGFYCATKFALEAWTEAVRYEVAPFGISAVVVAPQAVRTPAGDTAMRAAKRLPEYAAARQQADEAYTSAIRTGIDPRRVAETISEIVRTRHPAPRYRVGMQSAAVSLVRGLVPNRVYDAVAKRLFRFG